MTAPTPLEQTYKVSGLVSQVLKHISTGKDGESYDIGRIMWIVGVIAYIGLSGFQVFKTGTFNYVEWGTGFGILNTGSGAAIMLKRTTEPSAP